MATDKPYRFKTITDYLQFRGLPKLQHPLISVINFDIIKKLREDEPKSLLFDFYSIALKRNLNIKYKYGQQQYDFDEGVLFFLSPGQVFGVEVNQDAVVKLSGWMILVHPDFLWNTPLAKIIKQYEYFSYSVNEALHLSEKEENTITNIVKNIEQEYQANIDKFSQDLIITQLKLLLTYADRFYQRQFITRKISNHKILNQLEDFLTEYFNSDNLINKGIPTVQFIAESLHISPNYLSRMLQLLTGQSTKQFIHDKLIDLAKEKLSTTDLSINEIAYDLGFEHPQSFSKLFKSKTNFSPLEFRQSFN
jgi:AraC family transcriptional regulator, transcriptional activator of pobA